MFDNIFNDLKSAVSDALGSLTKPLIPNGGSLRYPLGDVEKYENVIKFTALARVKKSKYPDFRVPEMTKSTLGSVVLYMPSGTSINDNLSYEQVDTGIGGIMMNTAAGAASANQVMKDLNDNSKQLIRAGVSQLVASQSGSKGLAGGAISQALINSGEVVNPHAQMLFKAPAMRQFSYTFKLVPRTLAEAKQIIEIVKFFRTAAYPELGNGDNSPTTGSPLEMSTFKFPDIFQITHLTKGKENQNMIKHVDSYLTSVTVTYNSSSPSFYDDGMPSEIDLTLSFQESKALNRAMIKGGY